MLVRVGTLSQALGIRAVTWHWSLDGWRADAPNADERWKAIAIRENSVFATGVGRTGQEALEQLLKTLEVLKDEAFIA